MPFIGNQPSAIPLTSADITDGIISTAKIANNAVTSAKIVDGTIALVDLSATGTQDATTFLRGDNSFATVSSYTNSDALTLFNATGSAPVYACRAWVNFNGTGAVAIREDGNVTSITDNGTGNYTVNFTTAMPDANYSVASSVLAVADNRGAVHVGIKASDTDTPQGSQSSLLTSSVTVASARASNGASNGYAIDSDGVHVSIFR